MASFQTLLTFVFIIYSGHSEVINCYGDCSCHSVAPTPGEACTLNCNNIDICKGSTLNCRQGDPCIINCKEHTACSDRTQINGNTATHVSVICDGTDACKAGIKIKCGTGDCKLQCDTSTACHDFGSIDLSANPKSFQCTGDCPPTGSDSGQIPISFSASPTIIPTTNPTIYPTTYHPTNIPAIPTIYPTPHPFTDSPTLTPTATISTITPTVYPTIIPTVEPTILATTTPTFEPTKKPINVHTVLPTCNPTNYPSIVLTEINPSNNPTNYPSIEPTTEPTLEPTTYPTTVNHTKYPTRAPTKNPSKYPTNDPTSFPTYLPTIYPSISPTNNPTHDPTSFPTFLPTIYPTMSPTTEPTMEPTTVPTMEPSTTDIPTMEPSTTIVPSVFPTYSLEPSKIPTLFPIYDRHVHTANTPVTIETNDINGYRSYDNTMEIPLMIFQNMSFVFIILATILMMIGFCCCLAIFAYFNLKTKEMEIKDELLSMSTNATMSSKSQSNDPIKEHIHVQIELGVISDDTNQKQMENDEIHPNQSELYANSPSHTQNHFESSSSDLMHEQMYDMPAADVGNGHSQITADSSTPAKQMARLSTAGNGEDSSSDDELFNAKMYEGPKNNTPGNDLFNSNYSSEQMNTICAYLENGYNEQQHRMPYNCIAVPSVPENNMID